MNVKSILSEKTKNNIINANMTLFGITVKHFIKKYNFFLLLTKLFNSIFFRYNFGKNREIEMVLYFHINKN